MENNKTESTVKLSFAALHPFVEENIPSPEMKVVRGQDFVSFGTKNTFPSYLFDCYRNVSLLQTLIDGTKDYVNGQGIQNNKLPMSDRELEELVEDISLSYLIYGGFYLNVLRNKMGKVCKIVCLDYRKVRVNEDLDTFFYSDDYDKKSYGRGRYIKIPVFNPEGKEPSSIYYFRRDRFSTYALPLWGSALTAVELQREINKYHLNSIKNQFCAGTLVSLNNGIPSDEVKEEIEKGFENKFTGTENANRLIISYSDDVQHAPRIQKIETDDFGEKYETLAKRSQNELFCSFRANPNIFGLATESLGFNQEEYTSAFALFNKTVVQPIQRKIIKSLGDVWDIESPFEIIPFKVDFEDAKINNTEE